MSTPADLSNISSHRMILGDWGTSACRLLLCEWSQGALSVKARLSGKGIKHVDDAEAAFFELCQHWFDEHGAIPVFLIGTVGANIGWKLTPYVSCPTDQHQLMSHAVEFTARNVHFTILPGLSCDNRHGLPDIMRGEETQVVGYMSTFKDNTKEQLICLPGTHTKWVLIKQGTILSFLTSPVGELFEVLSEHSVLISKASAETWCETSYTRGLNVGLRRTSNILHTLFATRALQIQQGLTNGQAADFLSGLLIGADVKAAMQDFHLFSRVTIIGSDHITNLYARALCEQSIKVEVLSSEAASLSGLEALVSQRWKTDA